MASVTVDVDLDEFETHEILDEISYRWNRMKPEKRERFKKEFREAFEDMAEPKKYESMVDNMKFEIFDANKDKKTLDELERFFNA